MDIETFRLIISGISITIGVLGPALAIGRIGGEAVKAVGRNPEASSKIQTMMILGIAFAEALAIYVLAIVLIIRFVK
ncbi:MAG: ATP synthase subunit c [Candidatus Parcubacteria bacterium]|nr:MAG: ATP synthase subunit c [Candidatus Parcubacteria bacterium]